MIHIRNGKIMDIEIKAANHSIYSRFLNIIDNDYFKSCKFEDMLKISVANYAEFLTIENIKIDNLNNTENAKKYYSEQVNELTEDYLSIICEEYSIKYKLIINKNDINLITEKEKLKNCLLSLIKQNNYTVNMWDTISIFHEIDNPKTGLNVTDQHVYNDFLKNLDLVEDDWELDERLDEAISSMAWHRARVEISDNYCFLKNNFLEYNNARDKSYRQHSNNLHKEFSKIICEKYSQISNIIIKNNNVNLISDIAILKKCIHKILNKKSISKKHHIIESCKKNIF